MMIACPLVVVKETKLSSDHSLNFIVFSKLIVVRAFSTIIAVFLESSALSGIFTADENVVVFSSDTRCFGSLVAGEETSSLVNNE